MTTDKTPEEEYEESVSNMDLSTRSDGTQRIVRVPFIWDAIGGRRTVTLALKMLMVAGVVIGIWYFLGMWSFLGLLPIPFWYSYIKKQLAEEDFKLLEVKIPGQLIETPAGEKIKIPNRGIDMYLIPPQIFREMDYVGSPWKISDRFLICNYVDWDRGFIAYSERPALSNIVRYYDDLWLKVVDIIPRLEKSIFVHKEKMRLLTMRTAINLLDEIHAQDRFYLGKQRLRVKPIKVEPKEASDD